MCFNGKYSVRIWTLHSARTESTTVVCKIYWFEYFCEILAWIYHVKWCESWNKRKLIFLNSHIYHHFRIPNKCQLWVTYSFWHLSFHNLSIWSFQNSTCTSVASYSLNFLGLSFLFPNLDRKFCHFIFYFIDIAYFISIIIH